MQLVTPKSITVTPALKGILTIAWSLQIEIKLLSQRLCS